LTCLAFSSAISAAPKTSALQKSKAVVGLKGDVGQQPKKERKGDDNAHRVSEVSYHNL
jgi:hypothetical protein